MINKIKILEIINYQNQLDEFCRKYNVRELRLFGSNLYLEPEQTRDIDILVDFEADKVPGLLTYCKMEIELTDLFGKKVDLQTKEDLSIYFRDQVIKNSEVFYERKG